jgi:hypothetical protein
MKKNLDATVIVFSIIGIAFFLSATVPIVIRGFPLKATTAEIQRLCIGCGLFGIAVWISEIFLTKTREKIGHFIGRVIAWSMGLSGLVLMTMALFFIY